MSVLSYELCLLLLTFAPEEIWSTGNFECGEHGRFEYCIDEIPGCVIGCYCYPGYYFDADTKICEPKSKLLSRRRSTNSKRRRRKKNKKSRQSDRLAFDDRTLADDFEALANSASIFSDWLSKTFFTEVEKEAEKQANNRKPSNQSKNSKIKKKEAKSNKSYFRAISSEAKLGRRSGNDKIDLGKESSSGDEVDDDEDASDETESGEETSSNTENDSEIATNLESIEEGTRKKSKDRDRQDHRHLLVLKKPKPKSVNQIAGLSANSLLPSFIFLPSVDTPFYPPLGLPPPPVVPMYPSVPVPPVGPNLPFPDQQNAAIQPSAVDTEVVCPQCSNIFIETIKITSEPTMIITPKTRKRKKKKRKQTPTTTLEPTTTSTTSTPKTIFESTSDTTIKSIIETTQQSTDNSTADITVKPTTNSTEEQNNQKKKSNTKEVETDIFSTTESNSATSTVLKTTAGAEVDSTMKTTLQSTTGALTAETEVTTIEYPISTSITVNDSSAHENLRRAQDIDDYYLKYLNLPNMFDRRKVLKNQRMKAVQLNDVMLKNEDLQNNPPRWTNNNPEVESLLQSDSNIPLHTANLRQTIFNQELNDREPVTNNFNNKNQIKYISDYIHKPQFKDNNLNIHPENTIMQYDTNHEQTHSRGNDSSINDLHNVYYANLGRQIASLIRNPKIEGERLSSDDRIIHAKDNIPKYYYERHDTTPINQLNNADYVRKNNDLLLNLENKVIFTTPDLVRLPYPINQVKSKNDPKPISMQFLSRQQSSSKGTKNDFVFNPNLSQVDFRRTTRRPERSYIGRTFFSGDIM